ncbi:MAG: peptidylprolyl isomerase [Atopobiaceae bacterium]|nr:peptidylprolyl isomerase [Atopobiaceae bacterium]MCH4180107.1 peptidylprolyl isomerase [Atopobiaceae bacterium]MCH4213841.1 peptidylprolyl isomerase [Atopobiaceae bacterium]MCH4229943.1 peptidylprolyl isomerase [Atopobiaceae bacterium]MCH4275696.1 peptidylprolyl isomerase [Atopobiaceae bacterium]
MTCTCRRLRTAPLFAIACACVCCLVALAGCSTASASSSSTASAASTGSGSATTSSSSSCATAAVGDAKYSTGLHHATIEVEGYGTIQVELNASIAPITVSNFARLVDEGFYDGLTFHRVISGFMIQGGDPKGNGTGGSDQCIKGEFSKNGVVNTLSHTRGTISMARSTNYNSASSQFFIMQADNTSLDGQYAAFGHVTSGMDVVDAICANVPTTDSNGTVAAENQPKITSITMVD